MKWLYVSHPHHQHARNVGGVLYNKGILGKWYTGLIFDPLFVEKFKQWNFSKKLARRIIYEVPFEYISRGWGLEVIRLTALKLFKSRELEDRIWEFEEKWLDQVAAMNLHKFDGVIGFEHGCLKSLQAARKLNKPGVLIYTSPHHHFFEKWVWPEFERHREWTESWHEELYTKRGPWRDKRRDQEAQIASLIFANSNLTRQTLVDSGLPPDKVHSVPLGLQAPVDRYEYKPTQKLRILYSGPVSFRKGFPYLMEAFKSLGSNHAELHVYGSINVRRDLINGENIFCYGNVSYQELTHAYRNSDLLVFPSLCDGFGLVVGEALSFGLPIICSENAGAIESIQDGKNGFRVRPGDVVGLKEKLQYCLDHRQHLMEMREGARDTCRSWTWNDFQNKWFSVLKENLNLAI